ncbi:hypothetical protein H9Y04_45115, partial [Streptomyces sp. TRM66268-LWL]
GKGQAGAKVNIRSGSGKEICTDVEVDGSGNWTCDSQLVLDPGTYTFTASQTVNGKTTYDVFTFTRAAFSNATPVEVLTPTEDAPVTGEEVTFTGKGQAGAKVNIRSGSGKEICTDVEVNGSGNWTCDSREELPAGDYTFTASQTVNGKTTYDIFTFTRVAYVTPAPVDVLTPGDNEVITGPTVTFTGKGQPGAKINIRSTTNKPICTDAPVNNSGNWSCDSEQNLPPGDYTFTATQTVNGKTTQDIVTFKRR